MRLICAIHSYKLCGHCYHMDIIVSRAVTHHLWNVCRFFLESWDRCLLQRYWLKVRSIWSPGLLPTASIRRHLSVASYISYWSKGGHISKSIMQWCLPGKAIIVFQLNSEWNILLFVFLHLKGKGSVSIQASVLVWPWGTCPQL